MKTSTFILAFLFLFSIQVKAQYNYNVIPIMDYFRVIEMTEKDITVVLTEKDIEGSPYLEDTFTKGVVYTTSKQKIMDVPVRYNIYNDYMEFKTPENKILVISNPETIELIDFGRYKMSYITYINKKRPATSFCKILVEGKATLFAKPEVFFQEKIKGDGIRPTRPANFIHKPDIYYIGINNQPPLG